MRTLMWFREQDLRVFDNTALCAACEQATTGVIACFFMTPNTWKAHHMAACRVDFMLAGLKLLAATLADLHIPLLTLQIDRYEQIPNQIAALCYEYHIQAVFCNQQYEPNERQRDHQVQHMLNQSQIPFYHFHDLVILPPGSIRTQQHQPYTVFTPYKRSWLRHMLENGLPALQNPSKQPSLGIPATEIPATLPSFQHTVNLQEWPAGEKAAKRRLQQFLHKLILDYHTQRDFPALDSTSHLSPYLATGMISIRECLIAAIAANNGMLEGGNNGIQTWISELIWREFYKMILYEFPRVGKHQVFQLKTAAIAWKTNEHLLEAWKQGKTGFPIVDAAMRQLNQIGWMHNRLRMIVAMFLTKLLHIDWRLGEHYFMQQLLDGDLAANNGGWQWAASTGTDAVPYFRIFNPTTQSQKFDPEGQFIKTYCPELVSLTAHQIHAPAPFLAGIDYPQPIIDYGLARQHTLQMFKHCEGQAY